eukprot:GHVS01052058.1.p1 GENE.GHVS01052058.1~~GHVS01052058.1.p1  ORF type:complete len:452 (-),score=91.31 GHVS01052058.1:241-1518(-)
MDANSSSVVSSTEQHRVWRYNTIVLYDLVMTHTLEWPSLTIEWVPSLSRWSDTETRQRLIIGTHTAQPSIPNYLIVMEVSLPIGQAAETLTYEDRLDYSGFKFGSDDYKKFNVVRRIPHEGEINRARAMPQQTSKIASISLSGEVLLFDSERYGPDGGEDMTPDLVLRGHTTEGWGLAWNEAREGLIASAADDGAVCVWDINAAAVSGHRQVDPLVKMLGHGQPAQDVCWQYGSEHVLVSVGDDGRLMVWDTREGVKPVGETQASNLALNTLSNNRFNTDVVAVGGAEPEVTLWQLRQLSKPVHRMTQHKAAVVRVHFTSYSEKLLASASSDRTITIWDVDRIGMEQTPEDAEDGPPELVFTHSGHTSPVSDFSWNPEDPYRWMVASVAENNVLQIWQPSRATFQDEDEQEEEEAEGGDEDFPLE